MRRLSGRLPQSLVIRMLWIGRTWRIPSGAAVQTNGLVGDKRLLLVVYTIRREHEKETIRIITVKRVGRNVRHIPDAQIDFSDIPEATDEELRRARRVGRPATGMAKQLIAIRLSPRLLSQLRKMAAKQGKPYQTLIHELLEKAASHAA